MDKSMVRVEKAMILLKQKALSMDAKRNLIGLGYLVSFVLFMSFIYYHKSFITVIIPPTILSVAIYLFHQNYNVDKIKMLRQIDFMNKYFDRLMMLKAKETFYNLLGIAKEEFEKKQISDNIKKNLDKIE